MAFPVLADQAVKLEAAGSVLDGDVATPAGARALIVFVHGSGSSRLSPRNRAVARDLQHRGLATLLFDLLTKEEEQVDERTGRLRFDIDLLARRLTAVLDSLNANDETRGMATGLFGASTGAAAALVSAAERPDVVRAVVSRGGRPDLAGAVLPRVKAPTLLIVGGDDEPVVSMNRHAMSRMTAEVRLEIVPGATHLFEEPGALDEVARLAGDWFGQHLVGRGA